MGLAHFSILAAFLGSTAYAASTGSPSRVPLPSWTGCPFNGLPLPRPTNLASSEIIQNATDSLTDSLDLAIKGQTKAGFDVANTSFSLALISSSMRSSGDSNTSINWSYHHLGKNNVDGTRQLDDDSQYLIGSVSKLFTDFLLLESNIDMEDPITKYLPGLDKEGSPIEWGNITLSTLSNHLAGIPSNLREY